MPDENQIIAWDDQALQETQNTVIQPWDDFILDFWDWGNNEEVKDNNTSIDTEVVEWNVNNEEKNEETMEIESNPSKSEIETPNNQEETSQQWDFDITLWEDEDWASMQYFENWVNNPEEIVDANMSINNVNDSMGIVVDNDVKQEDGQDTQNINKDVTNNVEQDVIRTDIADDSKEAINFREENYVEQVSTVQENSEMREDDSIISDASNYESFSDWKVDNKNSSELNENVLWEDDVREENIEELQDKEDLQITQEDLEWVQENQNNETDITDKSTYDLSDLSQNNSEVQSDILVDEEQSIGSEFTDENMRQNKFWEYNEESQEVNLTDGSFGDTNGESEVMNENNIYDNDEAQGFTLDLTWTTDSGWELTSDSKDSESEWVASNDNENNWFLLDNYNEIENIPEVHEEAADATIWEENNQLDGQPEVLQNYNENKDINDEVGWDFKLDLWNNNIENTVEDGELESASMLSEENIDSNYNINQEVVKEDFNNNEQENTPFIYEQNNTSGETASNELVEDSQVITENTIVDSVAIAPNEKEEDIAWSIWVSWFADKLKEIEVSKINSSVEQAEQNEVKATLSLDQILDSELTSNPHLANNSKAVPVNTPVNSNFFNNKKIVWIIAWVWIFLLLWFVAALAFPTWNKDREPSEIVIESGTWYVVEPTEEHWSAPSETATTDTWDVTGNPDLDPYTGISEDPYIWTGWKPTSTVYFPIADDPSETEYEQPILEPEPYTCTDTDCLPSETTQESPFETEEKVSVDKIRSDIFSFKSQGEIYYSAGQSTSDRQLMKYASQMIYLCDNYEAQIDSWEGIDEESYVWFKSSISWVLSKIDQYINWWDETIVVQTLEDKSYFEGKDELKQYIYENR